MKYRVAHAILSISWLPLALMAAELPNPLAHWDFAQEAAPLRSTNDAVTLSAEGPVQRIADSRFDFCLALSGTLTFPSSLLKQIRAEGSLTFWIYTDRTTADALTQPLLRTEGPEGWLEWRLRWNRFMIYENNQLLLDTRPAGFLQSSLEEERWTPVVLTWKGNEGEVILRGESIGRFGSKRLPAVVVETLRLGSPQFGGKLAHLRVYDRMLTTGQAQAVAALNVPKDVPGVDDPAPNCPGETLGDKKRETGYTIKELKAWFPAIEDWPQYRDMMRLADSYDQSRFSATPLPGIHPRVLFSPGEMPELRQRLADTQSGRQMIEGIRGRCLQVEPTPKAWMDDLQGPDFESNREGYAKRGIRVVRRMGYHGPWMGGWLNALAAGNVPQEMKDDLEIANAAHRNIRYLMYLLPYEAFRALMDQDEAALARVGKGVATVSRYLLQHPRYIELYKGDSWGALYQLIYGQSIGLVYDMAYNQMSEQDRKDTRRFIAAVTKGKHIINNQSLPALPANTTNWIGMSTTMLPMILAIEGEEGFDPLALARIVESQKKWVYIANGPLGAPFEGFKKSGYMPWWLVDLAKHGHPFIGAEYSKNVYRKYSLHMMVPWGGTFIYESSIATIDPGIPYMKHAHPDDPVIDMLFARFFLDRNETPWPATRSTYAPLYIDLNILNEPLGFDPRTYDWDKTFARTMDYLKDVKEPLSYYSDYRGVMTARTGWDQDAVMFYMEPRNVAGGHTHGSRNEFLVVGLGREWSTRHYSVEAPSTWHSVILVDGEGQGQPISKTPQGRTLALYDTETATFLVGDATWAYSYGLTTMPGNGAEPIPYSPNDSRLEKSPIPWMNVPWSDLPQWLNGGKPSRKYGSGHGHWKPYNPVEYAFRTGGLIRGKYPYVLVVDDFKKDDEVRSYTWQMQLAEDLNVEKTSADGMLDLALVEDGPRRCLVRCLEVGGDPVTRNVANDSGHAPFVYTDRYGKPQSNNRLIIQVTGETGTFKTLIYPYTAGMPLPKTRWNSARTKLMAEIGDQKDLFLFNKQADGRTIVSLSRNGKTVF